MLPNFIAIGGERCGTTWMYNCLKEHPEIFMSDTREIDFFSRNYEKGIRYYESLFDEASEGRYKAIGEKSTDYLSYESCPERIARHLPEAKLIVILRNPIDRAFSHYMAFQINESESFETAIKDRPGLLSEGLYYEHLKRYEKYFKKEQILINLFDDIWEDRLKFIQNVFAYLCVDSGFTPKSLQKPTNIVIYPELKNKLRKLNLGWIIGLAKKSPLEGLLRQRAMKRKGKAYPKMEEKTRRELQDFFKEPNKKLSKMLGRDLGGWR